MTKREYKNRVYQIIFKKPYLRPLYDDINHVVKDIQAIDDRLFVVWNTKAESFEVHTLETGGVSSFMMATKFLDSRVVQTLRKGCVKFREIDEIIEEVERNNRYIEESQMKRRRDEQRELADRIGFALKDVAWTG